MNSALATGQANFTEENRKARERLLNVVDRCSRDRYASFPPAARELRVSGGIVLMGGQKASLGHHLDLLEGALKRSPSLHLRALVDEVPASIRLTSRVQQLGLELLTPAELFARRDEFRDCLFVDRYCTWVPGVKYKARLREHGLSVLRLEQFLNAPPLAHPDAHFRAHSDFMLEKFDRFLDLEHVWCDSKSRTVYYTALAGFISMDFTWFAYCCDDHDERYLPSDIGFVPGTEEIFVDCGAHDGAESILFAKRVANRFTRICAFEPDRTNFAVTTRNLNRYMIDHRLDNMFCYPLGVYDRNDYLETSGHDVTVVVMDRHAESGGLFVARLDDVLEEMTYLKLEIEGAELAALRGAHRLIRADKPVLAVAAYHKPDDLLALTDQIRSFDVGYDLKLRHHSLEPAVLCIYCQPGTGT